MSKFAIRIVVTEIDNENTHGQDFLDIAIVEKETSLPNAITLAQTLRKKIEKILEKQK